MILSNVAQHNIVVDLSQGAPQRTNGFKLAETSGRQGRLSLEIALRRNPQGRLNKDKIIVALLPYSTGNCETGLAIVM